MFKAFIDKIKNTSTDKSDRTIITIVFFFLLIFLYTKNIIFLYLVIGVSGFSFLSIFLSHCIHKLWMAIAEILAFIMPKILLTIIFFIFLVPLAFLSKLFGKRDPMEIDYRSGSFFKACTKTFEKSSFEKTW
jgi:hypothetical protein